MGNPVFNARLLNSIFAVGLLVLAALSLFSYRNTNRSTETSAWVQHTGLVLSEVKTIHTLVLDLETGRRGYIITGNEVFLEPSNYAIAHLDSDVDGLSRLISDNPVQRTRIGKLKPLIEESVLYSERIVALRKAKGFQAAAAEVLTGKKLTDAVRAILDEMDAEEEKLLRLRMDAAKQQTQANSNILLLGTIFVVLILGGSIILTSNFQKRLRAANEEIDRFFSVSLDMLCIAGFDGHFKRVNPAFETVLGFSKEELCAKSFLDFIHPDDIEKTKKEVEKQLSTNQSVLNFENRYRSIDGSYKLLSWKSVPVGSLMYAAARDVTQQKLSEMKIQNLNESLERQNVELAGVNKELESFSYSVSHDLRAPLRTIAGFSKILLEDHADSLKSDAKDTLMRVIVATQKMGQLIDGLLDLSRLTRTDLVRDTVNLSTIVQDAATELQGTEPNRKVDWVVGKDVTVKGDSRLLRAALANLVNNAWKFTSKQPETRIEFGVTEQNGKSIYYIRDNGAGFDMRHVDKLFGTFQRLHSNAEFQGIGIGLATVQRIVHRHGGRIWAEGDPGNGATFYFTL